MAQKTKVTLLSFLLYVSARWGKNRAGFHTVNLEDVRKWIRHRDKVKKEEYGV